MAGSDSKEQVVKSVLVINGPNLNLLGSREIEKYGSLTLEEINRKMKALAEELQLSLEFFQSNSEGEIVNIIQDAGHKFNAIIINPAAYTHTSVAIRDALLAVDLPAIEVHLTNVYAREEFRHYSYLADIVYGRIMGFGVKSYLLALRAVHNLLR
jgi:3-dehydroquinate dehydratase-2